ncbi:M23 family metallopeptidase [Entomospira culicis]|uniref:M23 family metallopeptidase n=1 Tax=Entomospira culicis TaxID=2719989 RepID=A0A968KVP0_9SPIO|nr:M23 family metallopeptidase [Entomospira culicis]NIZ69338.1 M23 family metallopeptidase [Entomospira culicis]WDI37924.1 M23 family metallopeptidase [Entomospira culicis]WDI39551.1 M23 family metallopeptidase [Entomospira culicis]
MLSQRIFALSLWGSIAGLSTLLFLLYPLFTREVSAQIIISNPIQHTFEEDAIHSTQIALRNGEVLANAILRQLPNAQGVYQAVATVGTGFDLRRIPVGQEVLITYAMEEDTPIIQSLLLKENRTLQTTQALRNTEQGFSLKQFSEYILMEQQLVSGTVTSSLYVDGIAAGAPANKLMEMFDLFAFNVDFQRDIREKDQFDLIYEQYFDSHGNAVRSGNIIAAKLVTQQGVNESFRFEYEPGEVGYFNRDGSSLKKALLLMPVQGGRLTSGYSARRNPVYGYSEFHPALDFAAPKGTPIMSAGDGVVIHRGWDPKGYGNYVKVQHNNGLMTLYAHMSSFAASAPVGARVKQGQTIGYVGSTGMSTGPHVHYEVWVNGVRRNPRTIVNTMSSGIELKGEQLERFKEHIRTVEPYFS